MDKKVQEFFDEVYLNFAFLEEYGYQKIAGQVEHSDYYPESEVVVRYIGKSVGVEICWYFAGANIGVAFVELQNGEFPAKKVFWGDSNNASRAISLYSLAGYLNKLGDKSFLLQEDQNVSISWIMKRHIIISENMSGIIAGLSTAASKFAADIIFGDTSVFRAVMDYHKDVVNKLYP